MRRVAVLAFVLIALAACGSDGKKGQAIPADPTTTAARTDTGVATVTKYEDAGDYVNGLHSAKITEFGDSTIAFDVVQFLTGDAARAAYDEDTGKELDSDYYLRNRNPTVRTLPLSDVAEFRVNSTGGYEPTQPNDGHLVNASTFSSYMKAGDAQRGYFWLTIRDGKVAKIEEQYLP